MYDQLHKIKQDDDCVTVRYRPSHRDQRIATSGRRREGVSTQFKWPGGRTSGYQSEPELGHSDASKYYTLDRRRGPPRQQQQYETTPRPPQQRQHEATPPPPPPPASVDAAVPTVTTPRSRAVSESLKYAAEVYKNQPGRIENYEPGKSSIAEKEAKQWWDEVLDIFDGMEKRNKENLQAFKPTFMTYALKESGYESDTQLVVRRREDGPGTEPLSPAQQRTAYKEIQKGGDVPLHGLRKTAPEKPKDPEPELDFTHGVAPVSAASAASRAYESEPESPHRYTDSEVTIRYRSPVSALDAGGRPLSEQELSRRQAEAMRRLYQEERRRKYLYELQDINSRRHTDNFTPSQKSPIPLNRYDDLLDEYWTSGRSTTPVARLAAKALYNFVGQTPRELSFRRGDVILVKRQVDRNWYEGEHNGTMGLFPANYVEVLPYDHLRATPTKRVQEGQARARFNFIAQTRLELSLAKGELVNLIRRVDENWFEGRVGNQKGIFPVSYVEVLLEPSERPATTPIPTGKPVAAPAAHSLILNGTTNGPSSMAHHSYQPPTSRSPANYSGVTAYSAVPAAAIAPTQAKPQQTLTQTLHVDTHSDPVPYRALYNYRPQNDDELELLEGDLVLVMEKCDDGWYVGSSQRTGFFGTFPGNYVERL
ncbi:sorbin and SH3 domain-containing protein 1 isoform X3 [Thrips palmi]|uniref:Sorbin and SH3 domain-containing protein 1 isoform X3 n=1 Tax=Thrips palmi TaxID=161013 RepID=A0A6P8ZQ35_THRPL|nr:sorbin and SH3 domain-containing protein 1 isoform X3 [Thrips palmi]